MSDAQWPRVLVIGNNKANHYMMTTLWTNLPGNHRIRNNILQENFAFVVTTPEDPLEYPVLKDIQDLKTFYSKFWPVTYTTGSRYPFPSDQVKLANPLDIPTSIVSAGDLQALEGCLSQHHPEILVINYEEVEESWLMLARCMRALERLKISRPTEFHLPLLLLAAARGDEWEQQSLGDANHYYDALCKQYQEDLAKDLSYPQHAHYDHFQRELVGESIIDSLADVEEIISGACRSFRNPARAQFIEINACIPNRPGALATYVAKLAGIDFHPKPKAEIDKLWQHVNGLHVGSSALLPSYQYMRDITLDPDCKAFALTGYATLVPSTEDHPWEDERNDKTPLVVRVFANDGRNYAEREGDPDAALFTIDKTMPSRILQRIKEPDSPGVPHVIDRLTARKAGVHNTVHEFHKVLLDPQQENHTGKYACPGMTICRIAAFQNYVVASNRLRLQRLAVAPNDLNIRDEKLLHTRNYYCCANMGQATDVEVPNDKSPYARIFCCCHGSDQPGLIAMVLNTLLFKSKFARRRATHRPEDDWVINIDYFKHISCQNHYFTLNRLFGSFAKKPDEAPSKSSLTLPLHLLRILPIGTMDSAKQWYHYARMLHSFLNGLEDNRQYKFYWLDGEREHHDGISDVPRFDEENRHGFPVVLVIKRERSEELRQTDQKKFCELCGLLPKEYDCKKLRVWV
jgi:hypothetical protein